MAGKKQHATFRKRSRRPKTLVPLAITFTIVVIYVFLSLSKIKDGTSSSRAQHPIENVKSALRSLHLPYLGHKNGTLSLRLRQLIEEKEIVGESLGAIKAGTKTLEEALHGDKNYGDEPKQEEGDGAKKGPMTEAEVTNFLYKFIHDLHETNLVRKEATHFEIWKGYHDLTLKTLYPWDREYLQRMPERRFDGSIFLSIASYRDETCLSTISNAYGKAKNPDFLFIGLVQQNCEENCRSGVLVGGKMEDVEPDEDCHKLFCESELGKPHCDAGRVRALHVNESESLGPYAARYFASKLWMGEQWYMQIDSHMTFIQDWDALSIGMLKNAPTKKPVISHYPPSAEMDLEAGKKYPAPRLCGPIFANSDLESQIIRLSGQVTDTENNKFKHPRFAPYTAAGYFVAHSDFLREVPFDPFLPWIFMGEEIIMSARLWTAGYDIYSPTISVVGHAYVRRHKPKFWETVHRTFHFGVHNPLQMLILNRVKYQLGYPESARDMVTPKSVLTAIDQYTMGTERKLEDYLKITGLDMAKKELTNTFWCEGGYPPQGFEKYNHLYK